MRLFQIFNLLIFICHFGFAQVDRYEMPVDTLPMGGKESQEKKIQMESQDDLVIEIKALNDSIAQYLLENKSTMERSEIFMQKAQALEVSRKNLNQTMTTLKKPENHSGVIKDGYQQLEELRAQFRSLRTLQRQEK